MEYTQTDIDSLAQKLAAAELTEGERAVMDALVDAADGEVAGFSLGLSFAPLKPAEFLQVRKDSGEAHLDFQDGTGNVRKDITIE